MFISWTLVMPSFKKSLIVEQFQRNYLKTGLIIKPVLIFGVGLNSNKVQLMKSFPSEPGLTFQNCYFLQIKIKVEYYTGIFMYLYSTRRIHVQSNLSIQTPLYYGQFSMSQQNSHTFSLKKPLWYGLSLIRTTNTKSRPQWVNLYKLNLFITHTAVIGDQVSLFRFNRSNLSIVEMYSVQGCMLLKGSVFVLWINNFKCNLKMNVSLVLATEHIKL